MKKTISLILALLILASAFVFNVSAAKTDISELSYDASDENCIPLDDAVKAYEKENGVSLKTYRNYFYIPDGTESFFKDKDVQTPTWYNEYFSNVCIWYNKEMCHDTPMPICYCGYSINRTKDKNIYYADIPVGVESYIINNGVDRTEPRYSMCESPFLGPEESDDGTLLYHDNMIYVHNDFDSASMTSIAGFSGEWYYYLQNGCYSDTKDGECKNPEHDHSKDQKSVKEAITEYEMQTGEKVDTNRYYFLMPNGTNGQKGYYEEESVTYVMRAESWYNEYSDHPSIYWWNTGIADPPKFPGYTLEKGDAECVFYADVPKAVKLFQFNNSVDYVPYTHDPMLDYVMQTSQIPCEFYPPNDHPDYPDGVESFDRMIFVIYPITVAWGPLTELKNPPVYGQWYYYYGGGCYGLKENGNVSDCIRDDHFDENGKHIPVVTVMGDVDGDGKVSVLDATQIQRYKAEIISDDMLNLNVADVDKDGKVTVIDATQIQRYKAQLCNLDGSTPYTET